MVGGFIREREEINLHGNEGSFYDEVIHARGL